MESLTKKEEKLIRSLQNKKFREKEQLFFVEGAKMVEEAVASKYVVRMIVATSSFLTKNKVDFNCKECDELTMNRISAFKTAPGIIAVVEIPTESNPSYSDITVAVDRIQDPGNLGTIIRTADAFGVKTIICSEDTVDHFSPKVVQASMGSIFRVKVLTVSLNEYLKEESKDFTVYAAHLKGENLYQEEIKKPAMLMVGNESKGIDDELLAFVDCKVKIPIEGGAESFNASIASAILLSEFKRQFNA